MPSTPTPGLATPADGALATASPGPSDVLSAVSTFLFTDIEGSTRLWEEHAGEMGPALAQHDRLLRANVEAHGGRVIKTTGDGVLAAFASVVSALQCAIDIQAAMAERNAGAVAGKRIEFRMGLHAADVVVEGGDIFGDGVNVAARLEAMAEPGGICVSGRVQEDTLGRIDVAFDDWGEQTVKNIPRPVRTFRVRIGAEAAAPETSFEFRSKASIAVLPLQNRSGDPDQAYFAEAITEDLVTALSKWRWFFVIARNSSAVYEGRNVDIRKIGRELGVRYLLDGSVRKIGDRVRVTVQLIDATDGAHLWADRFDRDLVDILTLQDEITQQVVTAIEPAMLNSEGARIARKNIKDYSALDCFHRGMWHLHRVSRAGYENAVALFREAIARDPEMSFGYIGLARILYGAAAIYGWSSNRQQDLTESREAALTAIGLDPSDAYAHYALSGSALYLGRHMEALEGARRAVALNPNFALGYSRLGQVLTYVGRPAEAVGPIQRCLRHSPFDPQRGAILASLAFAYYQSKDYLEAATIAQAALQHDANVGLPLLAASLARLGRDEEASRLIQPEARERLVRSSLRIAAFANEEDRFHYVDGLKLAGLMAPAG